MMIQIIEKYYRLLIRASSSLESPFLLAVRLYWGWQFAQAGWGKLHDIGKVIGFFTHLGIPAPALNAYFVSALEFAGGLLLAVGLMMAVIEDELSPADRGQQRLDLGVGRTDVVPEVIEPPDGLHGDVERAVGDLRVMGRELDEVVELRAHHHRMLCPMLVDL